MMRVWLAAALALGACASLVRAAEPATPPSCAILSGSGNRAPDPAVRAVLEARLFAESGLRFVEREEVARVVQEHNLASAEWSASASRVKLGSILPADALVFIQGIADAANGQTRIDVTESRSGVMLGSWIEENAAIRSAPDAIVARIRTAAEKTRIAPEARHLIGLLDFRGEESGLQMESAATTLSDLTIPALSRIPNVLVLDREHIEHLQTERDLTAMEAKLRPSVMLLEGGLRTGGTTNEYAITVQLRRLAGGGATNRAIVAPRADLVVVRDRVVEAVAAILGTLPAGTTDVSRAEEAAAFARQIPLWQSWGDHARAVRCAEAAYAIDPCQANRIALASILHDGGQSPLEQQLRAKQLELDYDRVQLAAIAAGATNDLNLPVFFLSAKQLNGPDLQQQPGLVHELVRLDEIGFRTRLRHYAEHLDECEAQYWATWAARSTPLQAAAAAPGDPRRQVEVLWEVMNAFADPRFHPERFPLSRLRVVCPEDGIYSWAPPLSGPESAGKIGPEPASDAAKVELMARMIRHPHPLVRLLGHAYRHNRIRNLITQSEALESRHATFAILTDEVPASHPYRQHTGPGQPWYTVDQWAYHVLYFYRPLDLWAPSVPASAVKQDVDDKIRYIESLVESREPGRLYMLDDILINWLDELATKGRPEDALRLTVAIRKLEQDYPVGQTWASSWRAVSREFWTDTLPRSEAAYRRAVGSAATQAVSVARSPAPNRRPTVATNQAITASRVWAEYDLVRHPLQLPVQDNPVVAVDGNRVCMVCPCDDPHHQSEPGVHAYLFWASSGALLGERHVAMPPWPPLPLYAADSIHSAVLATDTAYVGTSLGLLCIPFGRGEPRLLTQKDGLPGKIVRAVGWYAGRIYLGFGIHPESRMREFLADGGPRPLYAGSSDEHTYGSVLASWNPASNRFEVLASEKAVAGSNPLDGTVFCLDAIVGDPVARCIWLDDRGLARSGRHVWRYDPQTSTLSNVVSWVDARGTKFNAAAGVPTSRHLDFVGYVFIPQLGAPFGRLVGSRCSLAFDSTNVVEVSLDVDHSVQAPREITPKDTYILRRGSPPEKIGVCSNGLPFPKLYSVHETASGVIALPKDGPIMLIQRKDRRMVYLATEAQATDGSSLDSRLLQAAAVGRPSEVAELLDAGAHINADDLEGKTALMYAIRDGRADVADLLLKRGASATRTTFGGVSSLSYAAQAGDVAIAERLLSAGADAALPSRYRMTPLLYAASAGHLTMVRFLVERGVERNAASATGWGALHFAVANRDLAMADYLLGKGLSPSGSPGEDVTPLQMATTSRQPELVRLLLERGAHPDAVGSKGQRPLLMAAERDDAEIAAMLLQKGADREVMVENGGTLLVKAAHEGRVGMVKELVKAGAKIDAVDFEKQTPLLMAAMTGVVEVVEVLLDAGANIEAKNSYGCTPLHLAVRNKNPAVTRLLIQRKANVNSRADGGWTPLHTASFTHQFEITKLLLENGADPKAKNENGTPALMDGK